MTTESPQNPLLKQIDLGFQVEAFLQSDIGKHLIERAESEVEEYTEKLKRCDPDKPSQIRAIQHAIQVAESVQYWLAEAIQSGLNAQQQLHEQGV